MSIYTNIEAKLDSALSTYVYDTSADLIGWLLPYFTSLLILYIAFWGFAHLLGKIEESLNDAFRRILKIGVILALGLTVATYNDTVVTFLQDGPQQLAGIVTDSSTNSGVLDGVMDKGLAVGSNAWEEAGVMSGDFGFYILALIVWFATVTITAYAAFLMFMSKVALALLLAIGPLFIVLILFDATKKFFESWLGMVFNYALLLVLAAMGIHIIIALFNGILTAIDSTSELAVGNVIDLVSVVILGVLILRQIPSIASALGGGIALATQGAVSGAMRSMGNYRRHRALVGGRASGPVTNPISNLFRNRFRSNSIGRG